MKEKQQTQQPAARMAADQKEPEQQPRGFSRFFNFHPPVFWPVTILSVLVIGITLAVGSGMKDVFNAIQQGISDNFGWLLVGAANVYLFVMLFFAFSRFGNIRLGGKKAVPDFSRTSWFAMLFSAGMGIGILFWSVAEPIFHFTQPPHDVAGMGDKARVAMDTTFLHWGLHPWGIYSLVGMSLAFFAFNRDKPIAIRSIFYPLLGERINGFWGHAIDVLAVLATLFGLATSLGLGVQQINAGLHHLFGVQVSASMQILLVAGITVIASLSVVSGLDQGVKRLSELNINLGALLLVFLIIFGPTVLILDSFIQNTGSYLDNFFQLSFWTESYGDSQWQNQWTLFYWAWWISWSPFVGMFIARISRGRTVREFVLSVLIIPTLLTFLWVSAFGGSALFLEISGQAAGLQAVVQDNVAIALYSLLEHFPLASVTNLAAVLLVVSFFVTSADSGSLVIDAFTSGGSLQSPVTQRVFWTVLLGTVAAVLLVGGGLSALQTAAVATGLPFAVILLVMTLSLYRGMRQELEAIKLREKAVERESYQELIEELLEEKVDENRPPEEGASH